MAKLEHILNGDFGQILKTIENGILNGSMSASLEDSSDIFDGDARCSVRVFERYSYAGGNRVSMNVTLFQNANGPIYLSAITSGGSQAVLFKFNTFGEMINGMYFDYGDRVAIKYYKKELIEILYKDLVSEIGNLYNYFKINSIKNKNIGIISENRYEYITLYLSSVFDNVICPVVPVAVLIPIVLGVNVDVLLPSVIVH